ncbi:MAG TPA: patatin-like phospholipase family protein [Pyrinomonadaceae bacterium]|nr:patatin-like phospholipase family protein [Pyrinomonadaceae bacterium]
MTTTKMIRALTTRLLILLALLCACQSAFGKEIRVGITEYQNVEEAYQKYQTFFRELEELSKEQKFPDGPVTFSFAIGTYAEVIDWYNKKLIDVAVLSAMPIADLLSSSNADDENRIRAAYLGSLSPVGSRKTKCGYEECQRILNDKSLTCVPLTKNSNDVRSDYQVSVVVPAEYGWTTFEDVKKAWADKKQKLKFLFVRPVSLSGYILPINYLKENKIELGPNDYEFTYQHQYTLERMLKNKGTDGPRLVGFTIDNTPYCASTAEQGKQYFTTLDAPGLSDKKIPHEAVLSNYNLKGVNKVMDKKKGKETDEYDRISEIMRQLLKSHTEGASFRTRDRNNAETGGNWLDDYKSARDIYKREGISKPLQYGSSFSDLITSLITYENSTGNEPRLALVLSGGGAKCAYQAGAVVAIEKKLAELRTRRRYEHIDFNLVVGTSGGAINALLTALGGTKEEKTRNYIKNMWAGFDQHEFFTPPYFFNMVFGLCLGLLQALAITFVVLLFGRRRIRWKYIGQLLIGVELAEIILAWYLNVLTPAFALLVIAQVALTFITAGLIRLARRAAIYFLDTRPGHFWSRLYNNKVGDWWRLAGWLMLAVSFVEFLIARLPHPMLPEAMDKSHAAHHLWLIISLISSVSYPWPLILGLLMVLSGIAGRFEIDWHSRRLWLVRGLAVLVIALAGVLVLDSLWKQRSLSNVSKIESAFIEKIPEMIRVQKPDFALATGREQEEKLQDISRRIVSDPSLIQRDLVITVSNLPLAEQDEEPDKATDSGTKLSARQLPEDLYFFYKSQQASGGRPPNERRFIDLGKDNPDKLLDVVIGSGTIYPLFPYRVLEQVKVGEEPPVSKLKVIDGGFIHNSPIEAAIKWGATHIILIEASPLPKPFDPENTLDNSLVAFKYIMAQTQRMDAVARGSVEIFELRPRSECDKKNLETRCSNDPQPNMDTFDFTPSITLGAFEQGVKDAQDSLPLFKRVPGPPLFRQTKKSTKEPWSQEGYV